MQNNRIHIGTSGWHYDHWKGSFYPKGLVGLLSHYTKHFETVEINNSFYQLPEEETLQAWHDTVPAGFIFSVKASRYITHMKKLKDPGDALANFLNRVQTLGDKLGPVLFQLPPNWHFNAERLESFMQLLPDGFRYTFELRDPSWLNEQAYTILRAHNAAFCIYDFDRRLSPREVTADFVYIRLHGPDGAYQGRYNTQTLAGWAGALSSWANQNKAIFCYFDNDQAGYAPQNALELQSMLQS